MHDYWVCSWHLLLAKIILHNDQVFDSCSISPFFCRASTPCCCCSLISEKFGMLFFLWRIHYLQLSLVPGSLWWCLTCFPSMVLSLCNWNVHEVLVLDGIFTYWLSSHVPQENVVILQSASCLSLLTSQMQQLHDQTVVQSSQYFFYHLLIWDYLLASPHCIDHFLNSIKVICYGFFVLPQWEVDIVFSMFVA